MSLESWMGSQKHLVATTMAEGIRWDCMAREQESNRNGGESGTSSFQQLKSLAAVSHVLADSFKDLVQIYKGMQRQVKV